MRNKKAKVLRRLADQLVLYWIQNVVSEDEAKKININNLDKYLPEDEYYYANHQRRLYTLKPRWVYKQLKKGKTIQEILSGIS